MLEHPGIELQVLIKEKGLTQKAFSSILGKKVSEVNELLKGKRNITIQRDYLLHQTLGTPIKYRILKQIDYDYSLIDIEESSNSPLRDGKSHKSSLLGEDLDGAVEGLGEIGSHSEHSEESKSADALSSGAIAKDLGGEVEELNTQDSSADKSASEGQKEQQENQAKESDSKDDEDLKNRVKIFRSF